MNKYEERVNKIAEEMASVTHPDTWRAAKESLIEHFTPAARLSVKREADAYQAGYMSNFPETSVEEEKMWLSNCEWEMEEHGLIPPKTETT